VNFSVLLGLLWYFLYTPLLTLIEKRRTQIIEGVANAERAEAALQDADAKKLEITTKATLDAEAVIQAARQAGKLKEEQIVVAATERQERIITEATLKGEEIKREALEESKEEIARLIVLGVEKTIRESATART
jgi:F-type H+-transporting ATPase subunit b